MLMVKLKIIGVDGFADCAILWIDESDQEIISVIHHIN